MEKSKSENRRKRWWLAATAMLALLLIVLFVLRDAFPEKEQVPDVPTPEVSQTPEQKPLQTPPPVPTPAPTPEPTPTPTLAELTLEKMTLREKACQMFMVQPSSMPGNTDVTEAGEATQRALEQYPVGGFFYNTVNMHSEEQLRGMLESAQSYSDIPLLLTCDEEGGRVARLMRAVGTTKIGAMLSYKDQGTEKARENAQTIAQDMRGCGFNMDLAPVADVWSNPANTVIGDRAYSDDFAQAAELVAAAVQGFHDGGVACTLKHFPGHGDTVADSHYGAAYVYKDLDTLRREELLPFQAGIDAGADIVMMAHITVPEVDDKPALLSYRLATELLREEMGFDGVVMTDSLEMQAVSAYYSETQAIVGAVQAGVDLLLCPTDLDAGIEALLAALEDGSLSEARIDESVLRILQLKEKLGLLPG